MSPKQIWHKNSDATTSKMLFPKQKQTEIGIFTNTIVQSPTNHNFNVNHFSLTSRVLVSKMYNWMNLSWACHVIIIAKFGFHLKNQEQLFNMLFEIPNFTALSYTKIVSPQPWEVAHKSRKQIKRGLKKIFFKETIDKMYLWNEAQSVPPWRSGTRSTGITMNSKERWQQGNRPTCTACLTHEQWRRNTNARWGRRDARRRHRDTGDTCHVTPDAIVSSFLVLSLALC